MELKCYSRVRTLSLASARATTRNRDHPYSRVRVLVLASSSTRTRTRNNILTDLRGRALTLASTYLNSQRLSEYESEHARAKFPPTGIHNVLWRTNNIILCQYILSFYILYPSYVSELLLQPFFQLCLHSKMWFCHFLLLTHRLKRPPTDFARCQLRKSVILLVPCTVTHTRTRYSYPLLATRYSLLALTRDTVCTREGTH